MVYTLSDGTQMTRRKRVTVTGAASGVQTNYQINIAALAHEAAMQSGFNDLRFTKADMHTLIDAWLEDKTDDVSADVWAEFPTTPANGVTEDYWSYYGNDAAGADWDIGDTFLLGDDFPGSSFDTGKWSAELKGTGSSVIITGGECELHVENNQTSSASIRSVDTFTNNVAIMGKLKSSDDEYLYICIGSGDVCDINGGTSSWWVTHLKSGYASSFQKSTDNDITEMPASGARTIITSPNFSFSPTNYAVWELMYDSAGKLTWNVGGTQRSSGTDTTFLSNSKKIMFSQGANVSANRGHPQFLDWAAVRKHVANPPTCALGSEEHQRRTPMMT